MGETPYDIMRIVLAKSLAGHDKNYIYVVYEESDQEVMLVNGKTKPIDKPKRKNKKHVQLIKKLPADIQAKADGVNSLSDDIVRDIVDGYTDYLNNMGNVH